MATRIHEYGPSDVASQGGYPVVPKSWILDQMPIVATSSPQLSAAFQPATVMVCVDSDEQVYVSVNGPGAVTTSSHRIAAGDEKWFEVLSGAGWSVQVRT